MVNSLHFLRKFAEVHCHVFTRFEPGAAINSIIFTGIFLSKLVIVKFVESGLRMTFSLQASFFQIQPCQTLMPHVTLIQQLLHFSLIFQRMRLATMCEPEWVLSASPKLKSMGMQPMRQQFFSTPLRNPNKARKFTTYLEES